MKMDLSILGRNTRQCQWAIEHLVPLVWTKRGLVNCLYCCKRCREEKWFDFFWGLWHMPVAFAMLVSPENSDADSATHFFMPMNRFNWWKKNALPRKHNAPARESDLDSHCHCWKKTDASSQRNAAPTKHLHIVDRQKPASDFVYCIFAQVCISRGPNVHPQLPRAQHVNNYGQIAADDVLR